MSVKRTKKAPQVRGKLQRRRSNRGLHDDLKHVYTARNEGATANYAQEPYMFDDLIRFTPDPGDIEDFAPMDTVAPKEVLAAQVRTGNWLEALGVPSDEEIDAKQQQRAARVAFTALNFDPDDVAQRNALVSIKTPDAVQHLTGMLTAYDWNFIEQAKELRGYTVSKILEETKHPDARIRLKALQMLGSVTEVALFTERIEIKKTDASEEEIEKRLRERLEKFLTPVDGVVVREIVDEVSTVAEARA